MQLKLQELQEKLQAEEAEKTKLANKCEEIQNSCDRLKDQLNSNQQQQHEEEAVNQNHSVATNGPATEPSITEGGSGKK